MSFREQAGRWLGVAGKIIRGLMWTMATVFILLVMDNVCHVALHFCPRHFARFQASEIIPMKYGYPGEKMWADAARGKIVLGGCLPGFVRGVCPYGRGIAAFQDPSRSFPKE